MEGGGLVVVDSFEFPMAPADPPRRAQNLVLGVQNRVLGAGCGGSEPGSGGSELSCGSSEPGSGVQNWVLGVQNWVLGGEEPGSGVPNRFWGFRTWFGVRLRHLVQGCYFSLLQYTHTFLHFLFGHFSTAPLLPHSPLLLP